MITCIAIDDDRLFLKLIETYFEDIYEAVLLSVWDNPVRGALAISKQRPDVVLLDYDMPYMDGFQMLDTLDMKPKVIVISGHLNDPDTSSFNADLFVSKSNLQSSKVLAKAIEQVLKL
jgi:DNA-binding NarL/FixJ family response regulator